MFVYRWLICLFSIILCLHVQFRDKYWHWHRQRTKAFKDSDRSRTYFLEIVIGDTRDNRIVLPHVMYWTLFVEKRADIEGLLQSITPSSLMIQKLQVELVKIRDVDNVKLSLCEKCLYMKLSIRLFTLALKQCVEHVYCKLCHYTYVHNFRKIYKKNSYIEIYCELIVYAVDNIVYNALHEK